MTPTATLWLWRGLKAAVVLAILAGVGWTLGRHLAQLDTQTLEWVPGWLVIAGAFHLLGCVLCALFWWWTLRGLGQRPTFPLTVRAYVIGHLGKYVPGKALVPLLRTACIRGPTVHTGVAVVTVFYETFTVMAAGAVLGILGLPDLFQQREQLWLVGGLLLPALIVLTPWVFNRLTRWLLTRFGKSPAAELPALPGHLLGGGLLLGALNWICLGLSLWATVQAVQPYPLGWSVLVRCTSAVCLATVLAFATPSPGGLGVREWLLMEMLTPDLGPAAASLVAILLRLNWIVSELLASAILYPLPFLFMGNRENRSG